MDPNRIGLQLLLKEINWEPKPNRPMRNWFILVFSRSLTKLQAPRTVTHPQIPYKLIWTKRNRLPKAVYSLPKHTGGIWLRLCFSHLKAISKDHPGAPHMQREHSELGCLSGCHIVQPAPDLTAMLRDWLLTFKSVTIISTAREEAVRSGTTVKTRNKFSAHFHFYAAFTELLLQTNYCDSLSDDSQFRQREDA